MPKIIEKRLDKPKELKMVKITNSQKKRIDRIMDNLADDICSNMPMFEDETVSIAVADIEHNTNGSISLNIEFDGNAINTHGANFGLSGYVYLTIGARGALKYVGGCAHDKCYISEYKFKESRYNKNDIAMEYHTR